MPRRILCLMLTLVILSCKKQEAGLSRDSWKIGENVYFKKYSAITRITDSLR